MEDLGRIKLFEYQIRLFQDGNQFFENTFKNTVLIIGREDDCDLVIQDRSISRRHLRIEIDVDKFYVTDMGSSNGTFVDNVKIEGRTRITNESHIRAGKITVQVVMPELNKKVDLKDLKKLMPRTDLDSEGTLSRIALHVEEAMEHTNAGGDIMAMVDRDFIVDMTRQHNAGSSKYISKKVESLVLWNKIIYDINEFGFKDTIVVGPEFDDSIHVPTAPFRWTLSTFHQNEAVFCIPKNLNVFAIREGNYLTKQQLVNEKRIAEDKNTIRIQISHYDVLRLEIDANTQLYFRYVPSTVELESKRFLNPDVLIKKALITSFFIHLFLSLVFFVIPKDKLKPPEKKEPERTAKLIVEEKKPEPPPIVVPPPEPPPPPPPPPEPPPPPPPEVKKPEPPPPPPKPKPEPPKPKPKPKKEPPPKKVEKLPPPKPVEKASQVVQKPAPVPVKAKPPENPKGDNRPSAPAPAVTAPTPAPTPPAPPPPKPVDVTKLGALAAISGMKLDAKATKSVPANVTIAQNTATTNTGAAEVGLNAIAGDVKNQTAGAAQANAGAAGGPIKTKGSKSVGAGYGNESLGTGTGKRGVKGAVVGTPQLAKADSQRTEGLSRDQVLKAIQPHLGKIQSCYERAMLNDPNLAGAIDYEWTIAASGTVKSVNIKKNSVAGGEQLGECVSGVIRGIKFPQATNGEETNPNITFPFGRL